MSTAGDDERTVTTELWHQPRPGERVRLLGVVLWPSFLIAGVATMVLFANIDPETLRAQTLPNVELGRKLGYTIGFFMFWAVCAASSALTLFLYRPFKNPRSPET